MYLRTKTELFRSTFQKLEDEEDKQTDRRDRTHCQPHLLTVTNSNRST